MSDVAADPVHMLAERLLTCLLIIWHGLLEKDFPKASLDNC